MITVQSYEIPIEIRALKTASVYVINDEKKILVDTGMRPTTEEELRKSGVNLEEIDLIVLTHLHIDHIGGAGAISSNYGIPVGMGKRDIALIERLKNDPKGYEERFLEYFRENGVPEVMINAARDHSPILREHKYYESLEVTEQLNESYPLSRSGNLSILEVPGHSPGSVCIYVHDQKVLFSGDHILQRITPNISFYLEEENMLAPYLRSLQKTRDLGIEMIYPGHGEAFRNSEDRMGQLIGHHFERISEVKEIVTEWLSAYDVARRMKWSKGRKMDTMNMMERNFAMGEALSHLMYLYDNGDIDMKTGNGITKFRKL